jgi:Cu2+-exporting ATPase
VRLHVPELARKPALAEAVLVWLRTQPGVPIARFNADCASLVVEYDRSHEPVLQGILAHLKAASPGQLAAFVASGQGAKAPAETSPQVLPTKPLARADAAPTKGEVPALFSSQSPLGLPTLSLLMAFSANPLVVAANMPLMLWNAIPIAKRAWRVWSNERRLNVDFLDTLAVFSPSSSSTTAPASVSLRRPRCCPR